MMKAKKMAKILIIEDDAAISDVVSSTLVSEGYECTTAYSGSEAKLLLDAMVLGLEEIAEDENYREYMDLTYEEV